MKLEMEIDVNRQIVLRFLADLRGRISADHWCFMVYGFGFVEIGDNILQMIVHS